MIGQNITLRELVEFIKLKGGVIKGRGDGSVYWEQDEETSVTFLTAKELVYINKINSNSSF